MTPIQLRSIMQGAGTAAPRLARGCPAYHRRYIHTRGHNRDRDAQGPSLRAVTARAPRFDVDAPPRHTCQVHRCSREAARRAGGAWVQWVCGEMWDDSERAGTRLVRGGTGGARTRPTSYHVRNDKAFHSIASDHINSLCWGWQVLQGCDIGPS